jgi:hypothetical protein
MGQGADTILQKIGTEIFEPLYQFVVVISVLYFLYGVAKFVYDMRNPTEKNTGKQHLLWGMVGLFIILSVGGILKIFESVFGSMFGM